MRQLVLSEPGRFLERQVPRPTRGAHDALVRVRRVGLCGTDFHAFDGTQPLITFPRVLGHEIAGEVVEVPEVPPGARGLQPGDRCAIEPYLACGDCRACNAGRPNCCERLRVLGVHVDGAMQEFLVVPAALVHTSAVLSLDQLALVETLGIGANAVRRSGLVRGEEVLVIGVGPIGLSVVQFAGLEGATVRVVDKVESRRALAEQFGAEASAEPGNRLADVVFDATGSAASMSDSLRYVAAGGRLVFVGLCKEPVILDDRLFHTREVTLLASRNSAHQFPRIIRLIEEGRVDASRWITDRLSLFEVPRGLEELRRRPHLIKAIVDVDEPGEAPA